MYKLKSEMEAEMKGFRRSVDEWLNKKIVGLLKRCAPYCKKLYGVKHITISIMDSDDYVVLDVVDL